MRFSKFTFKELRELQEVLSNSIENDSCDLLDERSELTGASPIQERLLEEVYMEINERLTFQSSR